MKRFIFIYSDSGEFSYWSHLSFTDRVGMEEATFPKGTTDWEVIECAKRHERDGEVSDPGCAGELSFSRRLVRIVEFARDVAFDSHTATIQP